jgi:hypothetical protein
MPWLGVEARRAVVSHLRLFHLPWLTRIYFPISRTVDGSSEMPTDNPMCDGAPGPKRLHEGRSLIRVIRRGTQNPYDTFMTRRLDTPRF